MILLAAGCSRRFGSNKLLYEIEGKPMYLRALEQLQKAQRELVREFSHMEDSCRLAVVTQYEEIRRTAEKKKIEVVMNPQPEDGIASSLKLGLERFSESDGCLFAVADQPWLTGETIAGLVRLFLRSGKGLACAAEKGVPGNPCIFSRKYYPALLELSGDRGGKRVLRQHPEDVAFLEITDRRELMDMDFPTMVSEKKI